MQNFKHKFPVQLRFKDADMMGHVNNANYFTYVESARIKYFEEVIGKGMDWDKQDGIILARMEIDYRQAIKYEDKISVYTRCSRIGNKSFDLMWAIVKENVSVGDIGLMAEGKAILVCYDYALQKAIPVAEEKRKKLEEYEGGTL